MKNYRSKKMKNYRSKKMKNYRSKKMKNYRSKKMKNKIQDGGDNCESYIISGRHGLIFYDKSDMITIPDNIRLIVYSDFCGRSCNRVKTMIDFICNKKISSVKEIAYDIIGPQSTIPELYILADPNDDIKLTNCNTLEPIF